MSETKWTKGPWTVDFNGLSGYGDNGNTFNIEADGERIAALPSYFRLLDRDSKNDADFIEEEANAHLIASAPELFAALETLLAAHDEQIAFLGGSAEVLNTAHRLARTALLKARGQS